MSPWCRLTSISVVIPFRLIVSERREIFDLVIIDVLTAAYDRCHYSDLKLFETGRSNATEGFDFGVFLVREGIRPEDYLRTREGCGEGFVADDGVNDTFISI